MTRGGTQPLLSSERCRQHGQLLRHSPRSLPRGGSLLNTLVPELRAVQGVSDFKYIWGLIPLYEAKTSPRGQMQAELCVMMGKVLSTTVSYS